MSSGARPPIQYRKLSHVENLDDYVPGGYHPVALGDHIQDGRYVVVNKLGYGGASTVWLAHDTHNNCGVALSFVMSRGPQGSVAQMAETMRRLADGPIDHRGRNHILIPLDEFRVTGPNGTHMCFVMPVTGQSISVATNRAHGIATRALPLAMAKQAVVNLAHAISYMTACGVVHAVVVALSRKFDPHCFSANVKVSDFGDCFFETQPPRQTTELGPYVAPEYTSPHMMSCKMDVWLFECAIYQILSGHDLFGIPNDPARLVTRRMADMPGRPSDALVREWEVNLQSKMTATAHSGHSLEARMRELRGGCLERGMLDRRSEFSEEDIRCVLDLLQVVLVYGPEERPHIDTVLRHPTMTYFERSQGTAGARD